MTMRWRAGTSHHIPDALPRLLALRNLENMLAVALRKLSQGQTAYFTDIFRPQGPVLNGVPLNGLKLQPPNESFSKLFVCAATLAFQGPRNAVSLMAAALTSEFSS